MGGFLASLLTAALGRLWGPVTAAVRLPASVTRHYLSLLLSAVLYFFVTVLRVQPHGYIKVGKVVELQKVIDHLYAQVEVRTQTRPLIDDLHDLSLSLSLCLFFTLSGRSCLSHSRPLLASASCIVAWSAS